MKRQMSSTLALVTASFSALGVVACGAASDEKDSDSVPQAGIFTQYRAVVKSGEQGNIDIKALFRSIQEDGPALRLEGESKVTINNEPMQLVEDNKLCPKEAEVCYGFTKPLSDEAISQSYLVDFVDSNGRHYKNQIQLKQPVKLKTAALLPENLADGVTVKWEAFEAGQDETLEVEIAQGAAVRTFKVPYEVARTGEFAISAADLATLDTQAEGQGLIRFRRSSTSNLTEATLAQGRLELVSESEEKINFVRVSL